ncbi:hypothetical protein FIBSPDRAFT_942505 [Athelia psychrophila]|uniref:ARM repeat-containing protein n=1 Tax=Athelia psychrophila TaxID=1759441 RepID=A0A166X2Z5_9AGAM|nr:hypothetical protein FIBSPDRAFT_942505 [Fibularhizoctonia sp. CBS 109695]
MDRHGSDQEREIKEAVRRADKHVDRSGPFRRDMLKRLISLTHSNRATLKCYAAANIRLFFRDFPELEEEAINAVYDLCEDQDPRVRIEGYAAIIQVSKDQKRWVRRNADVLVQLLQSDESEEVIVVKRALIQHLDMDPLATLGVLVDQIVLPADPSEADERLHLRGLVLDFFGDEARHSVIRHANNTQAEAILVEGMLAALPGLEDADLERITRGLLLELPSFTTPSSAPSSAPSTRAGDLLKILLDRAAPAFKTDPLTLQSARSFLDLASLLALKNRAAPPRDLLAFLCTALSTLSLPLLPKDDLVYFVDRVATALGVTKGEDEALREQVINGAPMMVKLLAQYHMPSAVAWHACSPLLEACIAKKSDPTWTPPMLLTSSFRAIDALAVSLSETPKSKGHMDAEVDQLRLKETRELIRKLLAPPVAPVAPVYVAPDVPRHQVAAPTSNGPLRSGLDKLPRRPPAQTQTPTQGRPEPAPSANISNGQQQSNAGPSTKREHVADEQQPAPYKKPKRNDIANGRNADSPAPSLLSRLASTSTSTSTSTPAGNRRSPIDVKVVGAKPPGRVVSPRNPHAMDVDLDDTPQGGWSIRGAAGRPEEIRPQSQTRPVVARASSSLLDRMNPTDSINIKGIGADRGSYSGKKRARGRT